MADGGLPEGMTAGTIHQISPQQNDSTAAVLDASTPLKVMSFNLERGYDVAGLASFIAGQRADVLLLQELDWGCKRTNGAAVVRELSDRLGMHGTSLRWRHPARTRSLELSRTLSLELSLSRTLS